MDIIEAQAQKIKDDLLTSFEVESQKLIEAISIDHTKDKETNLIYHYTDDKGVWGILSSGKFWINSVFNFNDPSEISHGLSIACNVFKHLASQLTAFDVEFVENFTSLTRRGLRDIAKFHALSFSFRDDDLAQWRSYAHDGCGFALGLNKKKVEDFITSQTNITIGGFPIQYTTKKLELFNTQLFIHLRPALTALQKLNLQQPLLNQVLIGISTSLASRVIEVSTHFKHEAYESESEFRVLEVGSLYPSQNISQHRLKESEVVYYTELDWRNQMPDVIETITIGPGADKDKAVRYVEDCLKINQIAGRVLIKNSAIPYRPVKK